MASIINASSTGSGGIVQTADASGVLQLQNNGVVGLTMTSGSVDLPVGGAILTLNRGQYSQQLKIYTNAASSGNAYYEYTNPTVNAQYYTHYFRGTNNVPTTVEYANINQYGIALGNTASTDGTGIAFPATQNASTNANTLDDYEEGTWTPTIKGAASAGTSTYSTQTGKYIKVGNLVFITCYVIWNTASGTGNLRIGGLPFGGASGVYQGLALSGISAVSGSTSGYVWYGRLNTGESEISIKYANFATTTPSDGDISVCNSGTLLWTGTYTV